MGGGVDSNKELYLTLIYLRERYKVTLHLTKFSWGGGGEVEGGGKHFSKTGQLFLATMSSSRSDDVTDGFVGGLVGLSSYLRRRRYTSPVVTVSMLAKFYPIFWYVRPL